MGSVKEKTHCTDGSFYSVQLKYFVHTVVGVYSFKDYGTKKSGLLICPLQQVSLYTSIQL